MTLPLYYYVLGTPAGRARPGQMVVLAGPPDPGGALPAGRQRPPAADERSSCRCTRRTRSIFAAGDRVLAGQRGQRGHPGHRRLRQGLPGGRRPVPGDGHRSPTSRASGTRCAGAGTHAAPSWSRWSTRTPSGRRTSPPRCASRSPTRRSGASGTRQNVYGSKGFLARITDMFLDHRYFDENACQSYLGRAVSCLSGRTAVYRRELLLEIEDDFMHETFWGVPCLSGDDKRLTTLILERGHLTLHAAHAPRSGPPSRPRWKVFFKQRLRWARNTWRSDLRALCNRWVYRHPFLAFTMMDKAISSFTLLLGPDLHGYSLIASRTGCSSWCWRCGGRSAARRSCCRTCGGARARSSSCRATWWCPG